MSSTDEGDADPADVGGGRSAHLRRIVGIALLLLVVGFAAVALRRNWDAVRDDLGLLAPADYLAATAAALAGLFGLWASWWAVLGGLGARLPGDESRTTYFAGQLGKYVPGSVWPAVIQARLGRRHGIAPSTMVASYALWMGVLCIVGAISAALVLTGGEVELSPWVVLGAVAAGILAVPVLMHERGLPGLMARLASRTGRELPSLRLSRSTARDVVGLCGLTWLLLGVHAWFLARPLGADLGDLPLVVGAFALAFVAGIVAVPLPAGAGLRETVLVLTLGVSIGRPAAITVALVSRLIMVVAELGLASVTGVPSAIRWARRNRPEPAASDQGRA